MSKSICSIAVDFPLVGRSLGQLDGIIEELDRGVDMVMILESYAYDWRDTMFATVEEIGSPEW